ncbi:MAG: uroporphyrinogen-III synthase, partial [Actinobacteria bacterium]|nr:uroporphyrinogen-III synthase [Actinomycetota bacterium]
MTRIVVTRPVEKAGPLMARLEELGYEAVACPLIETQPLGDDPIDVSGYDWLVVTSARGADELARRRAGTPGRVAAIGPGTAAALRSHGIEADLVPRVSTQEGLLAELPRSPGRVLFAGAEAARTLLVRRLGADFVPLYRTKALRPSSFPQADLVVLTSPSAARAFAALGVAIPAVSIGPQTTAAATASGTHIVAEAK